MTHDEIRRMIRKLSRRRHKALKSLLPLMQYSPAYEKQERITRSEIATLSNEIDNLLKRIERRRP